MGSLVDRNTNHNAFPLYGSLAQGSRFSQMLPPLTPTIYKGRKGHLSGSRECFWHSRHKSFIKPPPGPQNYPRKGQKKEIDSVFMSVFGIHGTEASSNFHQGHETTLGNHSQHYESLARCVCSGHEMMKNMAFFINWYS